MRPPEAGCERTSASPFRTSVLSSCAEALFLCAMKTSRLGSWRRGLLFAVLLSFLAVPLSGQTSHSARHGRASKPRVSVAKVSYHGWPHAYVLTNGTVEVVVVPEVGRVMQFHFVGEDPVFWENPALYGKTPDPDSKEWQNFGGDKSWPAPQPEWPKLIGREWPPPAAFDSKPVKAETHDGVIELTNPIEPAYGIRVRRTISLDARNPVMTIRTAYEKLDGVPIKVGIGVITQFREPERAFMVLPRKPHFPGGYVQLNWTTPADLKVADGLLSLKSGIQSQIGSDAETLLWMNDKYVVRIDSPRTQGAEYADEGANAIIYTSAKADAYIELEPFGPLKTMRVGDRIEHTVKYTLSRRTESDVAAEVRKVVRLH
jgi:hypothetical protein